MIHVYNIIMYGMCTYSTRQIKVPLRFRSTLLYDERPCHLHLVLSTLLIALVVVADKQQSLLLAILITLGECDKAAFLIILWKRNRNFLF